MLSLDVTGVKSVDDGIVCALVDGCQKLTSLHLSLCTRVTDLGVKHIAKHAKHLTTLHLVSCNITDEGTDSFIHSRPLSFLTDAGLG